MYQTFKPDKRSGYLPLPQKNDHNYNAVDIGIKIATGFQILLKSGQSAKTKTGDSSASGSELATFVAKLTKNGFFENELEHSARWNSLYQKAINFYNENKDENEFNNESYRCHAARVIAKLSDQFDSNDYSYQFSEFSQLPPESDLAWLNINEKEFNNILQDRYEWSSKSTNLFKNEVDELEAMTKTMKGFVKTTSDFEGVEVDQADLDRVQLDPTKFNNDAVF